SRLPAEQVARELRESREKLSEAAGVDCRDFCYPYGDYHAAVKEQVRAAGYHTALAVSCRARLSDRLEVPRSVIPSRASAWQFSLCLRAPACWSLARRFV